MPPVTNSGPFPALLLADIASDQVLLAADVALMHNASIARAEAPILKQLYQDISKFFIEIQHHDYQGAHTLLSQNIAGDLEQYSTAL